jgi:hypothetical protein
MQNLFDTNATHLQTTTETTFKHLVDCLGLPGEGDDYKTDVEWPVCTPYGIATIYNWKNGKNYCGSEGYEIQDIPVWNIGGHNKESADYVVDVLLKK